MPLDPEVLPLLENTADLPYSELPVGDARKAMVIASQGLNDEVDLAEVRDLTASLAGRELPMRLYRPRQAHGGGLVYFHGGGWVLGSVATHDGYCRCLADASGATVVSVDYRLAPEHPFPAAAEDAVETAGWVREHAADLELRPDFIGVAGDSAGGNLAAVAAQQLPPQSLACQVLIYPIVDCETDNGSYRDNAEGYLLTRDTMKWFWEQYLPDPLRRSDTMASPLRTRDLRGLPAAMVLTAEYDPLRDEGEQYARRLADSGVPVELKRYDGMIHGFTRRLRALGAARRALQDVARFLDQRLQP